jgi:hypothetical protein
MDRFQTHAQALPAREAERFRGLDTQALHGKVRGFAGERRAVAKKKDGRHAFWNARRVAHLAGFGRDAEHGAEQGEIEERPD